MITDCEVPRLLQFLKLAGRLMPGDVVQCPGGAATVLNIDIRCDVMDMPVEVRRISDHSLALVRLHEITHVMIPVEELPCSPSTPISLASGTPRSPG